jgi:ribosome recycling factor
MTIQEIKQTLEGKMDQSIASFMNNLSKIRTGRANPALLDTLHVDYYGAMLPLSQVANLSLIDSRTIGIQPWEKGMGAKIEKAIRESDLGLNPSSMGDLIRVPMPMMTEETVKKLVKEKLASEDDQKRSEADIQKLTDKHISDVDRLVVSKEHDIMAV